jgi:hypothetical protein
VNLPKLPKFPLTRKCPNAKALPANFAQPYVTDAATNVNDALTFLHTWDYAAPTPTITSTAADPTRASPIPVTIEWSEAVSPNITLADLDIEGKALIWVHSGNFARFKASQMFYGHFPASCGMYLGFS